MEGVHRPEQCMCASAEKARWVLNVSWQMEGVDIDVDINIGRHLSALANTLTTFTDVDGEDGEEEDQPDGPAQVSVCGLRRSTAAAAVPVVVTLIGWTGGGAERLCNSWVGVTQARPLSRCRTVSSDSLAEADPRKRAKLLENRMNEQAKVRALSQIVSAAHVHGSGGQRRGKA